MKIESFSGYDRFLSNFFYADVVLDGVKYPTVENAYQASKCRFKQHREVFLFCTPQVAKRLGRQVLVREDWDAAKLGVMEDLVRQKFQKQELKIALLDTGDAELIEGNWWGDTFWGMCDGEGENHLGKILMKIRGELWTGKRY